MKRLIYLLAVLFSAIVLMPIAHAADVTTYQLDEVGISIDIPAGYTVYTRDRDDSEYALELMEQGGIYLDAWKIYDSGPSGIDLFVEDATFDDFRSLSDSELNALLSHFVEQYREDFVTVEEYGIYHHSQGKFFKIHYNSNLSDENKMAHAIDYITVIDGKQIYIEMFSSSHVITQEEETVLQEVVDSMRFTRRFSAEMGYTLALILLSQLYLLFRVFLRLKEERQRKLAAREDIGPG